MAQEPIFPLLHSAKVRSKFFFLVSSSAIRHCLGLLGILRHLAVLVPLGRSPSGLFVANPAAVGLCLPLLRGRGARRPALSCLP